MPKVAIILVNWNGKNDTFDCLRSLASLSLIAYRLSLIVVDNGSTDDSVDAIHEKFPNVDIVETGQNLGFTGGNNVGVRRALEGGVDFVWLLNNDTVVDAHALTALLDVFGDERVGIAGSKIYFAPGREYHKERYNKSEHGKVLWYAGGIIDWNNMYASHRGVDEVDRGQYDTTEETQFVTGCSMMIRLNVFEKIGLLDDRFFAYLEDLDFCLRAKAKDFQLLYVPSSVVWHKNAGSSAVGSTLHQYCMTRNRLIIGMRYAPVRTKLALLREAVRQRFFGTPVVKQAVSNWFFSQLHSPTRNARVLSVG